MENIEYYFDEALHLIWWQVFGQSGRAMTLQDAEEWVERQQRELRGDEPGDPAATIAMEGVERGRHRWR